MSSADGRAVAGEALDEIGARLRVDEAVDVEGPDFRGGHVLRNSGGMSATELLFDPVTSLPGLPLFVRQVEEALRKEIERIRSEPVGAEELVVLESRLAGRRADRLEDEGVLLADPTAANNVFAG